MNMIYNMLVGTSDWMYPVLHTTQIVLIALMSLCALFIIIVVLVQPGNSSGIEAISGSTETFLGKNKGKTLEGKMKSLTIICIIILTVLSVAFFVVNLIINF